MYFGTGSAITQKRAVMQQQRSLGDALRPYTDGAEHADCKYRHQSERFMPACVARHQKKHRASNDTSG